ncbi:hypothetical protein Patl1_07252 [Pistacia atlantica]|uniref:Uncharacterized protein n=1 Tax=Pistacia atlantica TaxID=434234 RepID=A0ACC1AHL7_9ROSI|nr:hypothetical protein Patl1_07252 [Pistacia atlantica]
MCLKSFKTLLVMLYQEQLLVAVLKEGRTIFLLQQEQGKLLLQCLVYEKFPLFRFLPTKVNKRMRQIYTEVRKLLRGIIEKRQRALEMGKDWDKEDLLGLMLKSNLNELQESQNSNGGMTTEDVFEECRLFYFAGQETTANLLTWTMVVLSMHMKWQERAREEVMQILGKNKPTFDDLNHLKIVNMILLEVLRLYPPSLLLRTVVKETKLGDLCLPAGVDLLMPMGLVHRDPEQWGGDAVEFNPERFSEGISKASKDQVSYFPFGYGPRICIGQNFAMLEAKLALSQILQHFSFELSSTYTHSPTIALTLQPKYGAQIILHKI